MYGDKEYSKGHVETDKNGVTVQVDKYGRKRCSEGTFIAEKSDAASRESAARRK
jgi:hypothetical protein